MTEDEKLAKDIREAADALNDLVKKATELGLSVDVDVVVGPKDRDYAIIDDRPIMFSKVTVKILKTL